MRKTTVYLPDELKLRLEGLAHREGRSEADLIREAVDRLTAERRPRPRIPLVKGSGDETIAENIDEHMVGFGED